MAVSTILAAQNPAPAPASNVVTGQARAVDVPPVTLADIAHYPTSPSRTQSAYQAGPTDDVTMALQKGMRTAKRLGYHMVGGLVDSPTALVSWWLNIIPALGGSDFRFETDSPISQLLTSDPDDLAAAQASQHYGEQILPVMAMGFGALTGTATEAVVPIVRQKPMSRVPTSETRPVPPSKPVSASEVGPASASEVPELGWINRDAKTMSVEQSLRKLARKAEAAPEEFRSLFLQAIERANHNVVREHSRSIVNSSEKVDFLWEYTVEGMKLTIWGLRGTVTSTFSYQMLPHVSENMLFRRYLGLREVPVRELMPGGAAQGAQGGSAPAPLVWLSHYVEKFAQWLKREEPVRGSSAAPTVAKWPPHLFDYEDMLKGQAQLYRLGQLSHEGFKNAVDAANNVLVRWVDLPITRASGKVEICRLSWEYGIHEETVVVRATLKGPGKAPEVGSTFTEPTLTRIEYRAKQLEKLYLNFVDLY